MRRNEELGKNIFEKAIQAQAMVKKERELVRLKFHKKSSKC